QSLEKNDALEQILYDRFTYGPYDTGGTSSSAFSTEQSQDEASLHGKFRMLGLGGSGECSCKRQDTYSLDDHGTGCHPVAGTPVLVLPIQSQD
ncbi:hypothetical protein MKX03_011283, partial [Papaver bracteatum]